MTNTSEKYERTQQGNLLREVVKKSKWKFKMAFAIRGPTPPPHSGQKRGGRQSYLVTLKFKVLLTLICPQN